MTPLSELVATSRRVGASASRVAKIRELADFLRTLAPEEISTATHYLSGTLPQGRIGIGFAQFRDATPDEVPARGTLRIADVDEALTIFAGQRAKGAVQRRSAALRDLLARATAEERAFLVPLLAGELRQGALGGMMIEAIAKAAGLPAAQVRRAAMYTGDLGALGGRAITEGGDALSALTLQLFVPVVPMLAQTATDVTEALGTLSGEIAFEWRPHTGAQAWRRGAHLYAQPQRGHGRRAGDRRVRALVRG